MNNFVGHLECYVAPIKTAWPDLHYKTVKGALVVAPSAPRIPPSQLRLVE